jgi:hypothetical protein
MNLSAPQQPPPFGGGVSVASGSPMQAHMFESTSSSSQLQPSTFNVASNVNTSALGVGNTTNTTNTTFGQFRAKTSSSSITPSTEAPSFTDIDAIGALLQLPTLGNSLGNRMSQGSVAQINTHGNFGGSSVFDTLAPGTSLPSTSYFNSSEVSDAPAVSISSTMTEASQLSNNGRDNGRNDGYSHVGFTNNMFPNSSVSNPVGNPLDNLVSNPVGNLLWPDQSGIPADFLRNDRAVNSVASSDGSATPVPARSPDNMSPAASDRSFNSMSLFDSALPPPTSPSELFGAWATAAVLLNNGLGVVERSSGRIRCTRVGCHNLHDSWAELRDHYIGAHSSQSSE